MWFIDINAITGKFSRSGIDEILNKWYVAHVHEITAEDSRLLMMPVYRMFEPAERIQKCRNLYA